MAAAAVLADAAAKVLCDDKETRRGICASLGNLRDLSEQLTAIDSMSEKGLGLRVSRGASPAIPPATPLAPSPKAPGTPASLPGTPFILWSPIVDAHIVIRDVKELQGTDRSKLLLEAREMRPSTSLPLLKERKEPSEFGAPIQDSRGSDLGSARKKAQVGGDGAAALRRSALNMGLPAQLTTTYNAQCQVPVQKAVDPKWSTDLKRADRRNAQRIQYENRLSAATPGSISPEVHFLVKHH
ncbi:unnamed protein product [Effrenium voratum]|nr:unnamed protein product [Effrenium voratum]